MSLPMTAPAPQEPSMRLTLAQLLAWLPGATLVGNGETRLDRLNTDTRSIAAGEVFVALRGERFDANQMLHEAVRSGAAALICHAGLPAQALPEAVPRIEVPDTRQALAAIAAGWRARHVLPLIAVTGSNGKTTVTQMLAAIVQAWAPGDGSLATRGNLNNDIGVPLTVLRLRSSHRIAVVEMGMNHPGEIAQLTAVAAPTVALVNNAQREHQEFMHSVEAVALENGAVLQGLPADGVAVFPADDAYSGLWRGLAAGRRCVGFTAARDGDAHTLGCTGALWADGCWQVQAQGLGHRLSLRLHIAGRHNVANALAAAACALAAGVDADAIERGLQAFRPVGGRSRALSLVLPGRSLTLVDDSYNANPDSVRAAIDVLAELPAPRLLVLGDMGEVGTQGPVFHAEVGGYAQQRGIDHLLTSGVLARHSAAAFAGARHFDDVGALIDAACALIPTVGSVLVKGSRFMAMERVVQALQALQTPSPAVPETPSQPAAEKETHA